MSQRKVYEWDDRSKEDEGVLRSSWEAIEIKKHIHQHTWDNRRISSDGL
jgi:hypothetical protein